MVVKSFLTPAVSTNDWLSRRLAGLKGSGVDAGCSVVGCISGIVFGSVLVIMTASPFVYATRALSLLPPRNILHGRAVVPWLPARSALARLMAAASRRSRRTGLSS